MKYLLKITPVAARDLQEIYQFLASESIETAEQTINTILSSIRRIEEFPESAPLLRARFKRRDNMRFLRAGSYLVFYRVIDDAVAIYRVLHGRRKYLNLLDIK